MNTNPKLPNEFNPEDLMSDEFWRSQGIEPITLDPNDKDSFKRVAERIESEVKKIRDTDKS